MEFHLPRNDKDPTPDRNDTYYLNEIIYLGRIYDYETENEHLVSAFQQFLDKTIDAKTLANTSNSFSFDNLLTRVILFLFVQLEF